MLIIYLFLICNFHYISCKAKKDKKKLDMKPVDKWISYDGYKAIQVTTETKTQVEWLAKFRQYDVDFDFWRFPAQAGRNVWFMIEGSKVKSVFDLLDEVGLKNRTILMEDVQKDSLDLEIKRFKRRMKDRDVPLRFSHDDIQPYQMIEDEIEKMATKRCPKDIGIFCEAYTIGKSVENRPLRVLKIHKGQSGRKSFFVIAGTHGREWFSTALSMTFAHLFNTWTTEPDYYPNMVTLLEDGDWHFLFVANPDGNSYSWTDDRMWNKNRGLNNDHSQCKGVDLSVNFDYNWEDSGASDNFCSRYYKGPSAASEPETRAIQDELKRLGPSLRAVIGLRDIGSTWNFPWPKGQNLDNMDEKTKKAYDLCRDASANGTSLVYDDGDYDKESCLSPEIPTGGDVLSYARHVVGVENVWEFRTASGKRGYGRSSLDLNQVSYEMLAGLVIKVYTLRNQTLPKFLVQDFSGEYRKTEL